MLDRMPSSRSPKPASPRARTAADAPPKSSRGTRRVEAEPKPARSAGASAPSKKPSRSRKESRSPASETARKARAPTRRKAPKATPQAAAGKPGSRTAAQRESAFDALVRSACLKAGTAAAITSITGRVPLLGRLAPTLLGPLAETVALAQVQKQLVIEMIDLYEVELSEPELRGVVLLATAANIGAQQLSKRSMDAILRQFGEGLIGTLAARMLPMATILAEITAAVASTYTVAKRAQALCKLPGTGAGNLAELLRGLSGIDQQRLLSWSGEAFRLALIPFRSVLGLVWK